MGEKLVQCPNCKALLKYGVIICPHCGHDTMQPIPQMKQFSCPFCNNIFSAESLEITIEIDCPMCKKGLVLHKSF